MKKEFEKVRSIMQQAFAKELKDQGHYLTGALEKSISVARTIDHTISGYALEYAQDLESGKKNFSSTHENELVSYFKLRGLTDAQAKQAAYRTNILHKKGGMPTEGSKRFSKTGERKKFITRAWVEVEQKVDSLIVLGMDRLFEAEYNKQTSQII